MRRVALIVNPSAGGGKAGRLVPAVETALRGHGIEPDTQRTRSIEHARELAHAAAAVGDPVVVLSGDGLVGAVAGALCGHDAAVMGVLPGGRGNDFARVAGIPLDAVEATAVIANGVAKPLDLGDVGGMPFIGIASLGFDSDANRIANAAPARLGNLVYAYGAVRALVAWKHAAFEVTIDDGEPVRFRGWTVACANSGAYGGGMLLAPDAKLDDGLLDVVLTRESSKRHFLSTLPKVFKGAHIGDPAVTVLRGRSVHVTADRPITVYADGDPVAELPATITVKPHALQVLLPA